MTPGEIRALASGRSVAELFNPKSPSVGKLGLDPEALKEDELIAWMIREPRLMKRPILDLDGRVHLQPRPGDVDGILA